MEGLIPMVYKAIKRNRSRQQHRRSLSSSQTPYFYVDDDVAAAAAAAAAAVHGGSATQSNFLYITPPAVNIVNAITTDHDHHRRHKSVSVVGDFRISEEEQGTSFYNNKQVDHHRRPEQLVRFRSHRSSFFSSCCISGTA